MAIRLGRFPEDFESLFALNSVLSPDEDRKYFYSEIEKFKGLFLVSEDQGELLASSL